MGQLKYLMDTNVAIDYISAILPEKATTWLDIAVIAATAINQNLTLLSRNEKDFKRIEGLKWQNLHEF